MLWDGRKENLLCSAEILYLLVPSGMLKKDRYLTLCIEEVIGKELAVVPI